MDETDRAIINIIQSDFPIAARPYLEIGERVHLSEQEVFERVRLLKEKGIIRRIGGNFDSRKLNFASTLCAAKVPEEAIEGFVKVVNGYPGVTHNYLRDHEYNVWFTFIGPSKAYIRTALEEISRTTGITGILNLPAIKMFKIRVDFEV
jgi:DNA-binding Lrp family transcriptional regulator